MAAKKMKQQTAAEKPVHNATAAERRAVEKYRAKHEEKRAVKLKLSDSGDELELDHSDKLIGEALLVEALGSADKEFVNGILNQLVDLNKRGEAISEHGVNFMLAVINGIEPGINSRQCLQLIWRQFTC